VGAAVSLLCLATLGSCGLSLEPVDYRTDLVLKVCAPGLAEAGADADCQAITTAAGAVRTEIISRLDARAQNFQGQTDITDVGDNEINVETTLTSADAIELFTARDRYRLRFPPCRSTAGPKSQPYRR
jgi:hypothetical protein